MPEFIDVNLRFYSGPSMAKTKIQLKHLERQIHEGTLLTGEQYYQEGRVEQFRELEKGLWQARVRLELNYEIEVLMRGDQVQAFTCPCSRGMKQLPCPHLIAVLLMMRNFRDQQREAKRLQKEASLPALQIRTLLPLIPETEIQAFVKDWASEDPIFAQALKARFFAKMRTTNPTGYLDLLLHAYQDADGNIVSEARHIQELLSIFRQVLAQVRSLLKLNQEETAYSILHHFTGLTASLDIDRISGPILFDIIDISEEHGDSAEIQPDDQRFHFLTFLLETLIKLSIEEDVHRTLLQIQSYCGFPESRRHICQVIRKILLQEPVLEIDLDPLALVYYQNLTDQERQTDWLEELHLPRMAPSFYERLVTTLLETGDFEGARRILETGRRVYPESAELIRQQIQLHWELHEPDDLPRLAEQLVLNTLSGQDILFAERYLAPSQLIQMNAFLIRQLADGQTFDQHRIACLLFARAKSWKDLAHRVIQSGSIRLLDTYADDLQAHLPIDYQIIMTRFLDDYLDRHVGPQAKQVIQRISVVLDRQQLPDMFGELARHIQNRYPHRPQLLDNQDYSMHSRL